ncbi:MAG: class I SAM-dependent methyltransferase, partial [Steroidobacteraceae bacterium]
YLIAAALLLLVSTPLLADDIAANITAAVAAPERSDKDRERDARDHPAEFMTFAGIVPGLKIADVFGGGGYWTELMARAVGPSGSVRLVNNSPYFDYAGEDLKAHFKDNRLTNAEQVTVETCKLKLGAETFDLIMIFMSYHDLYYVDEKVGWPAIDASGFLDQLHAALKPGGHLLIVDHAAAAGTGQSSAQDLHRIEESFARQDIASHGFRFEKGWDGYRNPGDDMTRLVFDPAVRGKTDRFTHLYSKR